MPGATPKRASTPTKAMPKSSIPPLPPPDAPPPTDNEKGVLTPTGTKTPQQSEEETKRLISKEFEVQAEKERKDKEESQRRVNTLKEAMEK